LTNKTPGILRTDNWSHLKNLLDAFNNESQHILLILPIIDVSSTIDEPINSIIKSEVEAKETNRKIKIEVDNRIKREKKRDKAIDFTTSTNDSSKNGFTNRTDDNDSEPIDPIHSKIDNSSDSDLTDLDDLPDIDSIIDESMKISQPRLKLNPPKSTFNKVDSTVTNRPKTPKNQTRKRSNTVRSPPEDQSRFERITTRSNTKSQDKRRRQ